MDIERTIACDKMLYLWGQLEVGLLYVTDSSKAAVDSLNAGVTKEVRITSAKLVEALQGRGANNIKLPGWRGGSLSKEQVEQVVGTMLVDQYLQEDMHYTPYSVISYLLPGPRVVQNMKIKPFTTTNTTTKQKTKTKKRKNAPEEESNENMKKSKLDSNVDIVISSDDE